jgi:Ser/Thr protein kinase RdoA (MazF antagonist)
VEPDVVSRAQATATSLAVELGLSVANAAVVHSSNKLALRLLPCDVLARVAVVGQEVAALEVELARSLSASGSPVAALDPRVEARVYICDGFAITFWTYYPAATVGLSPASYADALQRLHAGMRSVRTATPHFTDRVAEAEQLVANPDQSPNLADVDRELLTTTLQSSRRTIEGSGAAEQLLHGEPHPGNVLTTARGPLFIDLETCCRGPIEFDLAHVPEEVAGCYPVADQALLQECRRLVLAMVAAWRWDAGDEFPNGPRAGQDLLATLREGPPWPTLDLLPPPGRP